LLVGVVLGAITEREVDLIALKQIAPAMGMTTNQLTAAVR
jgi:hypothetical protein